LVQDSSCYSGRGSPRFKCRERKRENDDTGSLEVKRGDTGADIGAMFGFDYLFNTKICSVLYVRSIRGLNPGPGSKAVDNVGC